MAYGYGNQPVRNSMMAPPGSKQYSETLPKAPGQPGFRPTTPQTDFGKKMPGAPGSSLDNARMAGPMLQGMQGQQSYSPQMTANQGKMPTTPQTFGGGMAATGNSAGGYDGPGWNPTAYSTPQTNNDQQSIADRMGYRLNVGSDGTQAGWWSSNGTYTPGMINTRVGQGRNPLQGANTQVSNPLLDNTPHNQPQMGGPSLLSPGGMVGQFQKPQNFNYQTPPDLLSSLYGTSGGAIHSPGGYNDPNQARIGASEAARRKAINANPLWQEQPR